MNFIRGLSYIGVMLVLILSSCSTTQKINKYDIEVDSFVPKENLKYIESGSDEDPMRVLLITDSQDSIILRTKSTNVEFGNQNSILKKFVKRLYSTVRDPKNPGVGIAAPQVGILKNIIWVQRFDKRGEPFEVYINPTIVQYTQKTQFCLEGCLSIPNRRDTTRDRAYAILIEYDKIDGTHHTEMVEAFTAVIFQHEIDHLNGILYTDHLDLEIKEAEERMKRE